MAKAPKPKVYANADVIADLCGGHGKRARATIKGEPQQSEHGWGIPLEINGQTVVRTVKEQSKAYKALYDAFGGDFADWKGEKVEIWTEEIQTGEFEGMHQVVMEPIEPQA